MGRQVIDTTIQGLKFKVIFFSYLKFVTPTQFHNDIQKIHRVKVKLIPQRLIRLQADSPEAFINMGTAHWQLDQYEKALGCAQKAIALQPDLKEAHFNYAINLLHLADAEKAISVLENLLEQHPQYIAARFMLTAAYGCAGNKGRALAGCRQIQRTEIGPVLAVSFYDLAKRLVTANAIDYAIALLETAIECKSADENVRNLLSSCRQKVSASQQ